MDDTVVICGFQCLRDLRAIGSASLRGIDQLHDQRSHTTAVFEPVDGSDVLND